MSTKQEIQHLAKLARLHLSDEELEEYSGQIGSILEYIEKLQQLDTEGVPEMAHGAGVTNVIRKDEPHECSGEIRERLIESFPGREGDLLEVQAVFEERTV